MHACIVTCGGLCPGLNTVIREIVCGLYHMYGVHRILGIEVSIFQFHLCYSFNRENMLKRFFRACREDTEAFMHEIRFL